MIVYQSSQSKDDVFAIASYIYKDNQTAALPFLDCIEETYTMLGDFLKMGHKPYFDFIEGLLTITVKSFPSYSIFYRVLEDHRNTLPSLIH